MLLQKYDFSIVVNMVEMTLKTGSIYRNMEFLRWVGLTTTLYYSVLILMIKYYLNRKMATTFITRPLCKLSGHSAITLSLNYPLTRPLTLPATLLRNRPVKKLKIIIKDLIPPLGNLSQLNANIQLCLDVPASVPDSSKNLNRICIQKTSLLYEEKK